MSRPRLFAVFTLALVVVSVSLLTGHHVPLYDGVAFPDEPYRYIVPPKSSQKTALPPTAASATSVVKDTKNTNYLSGQSKETGPQILLFININTLQTSASATSLTVTATPNAPGSDKPSDGAIVGNVYRLAASSDGPITFLGGATKASYIDLRLPQGYAAGAVVEYRKQTGGAWTNLITNQVGNDIYEAPIVGFGDYAMVVKKSSKAIHPPNKSLIVGVVFLLAAGIVAIGLIRFNERHNAPDEPKKS